MVPYFYLHLGRPVMLLPRVLFLCFSHLAFRNGLFLLNHRLITLPDWQSTIPENLLLENIVCFSQPACICKLFADLKNKSICKEMQPSEERISQKDMDTITLE